MIPVPLWIWVPLMEHSGFSLGKVRGSGLPVGVRVTPWAIPTMPFVGRTPKGPLPGAWLPSRTPAPLLLMGRVLVSLRGSERVMWRRTPAIWRRAVEISGRRINMAGMVWLEGPVVAWWSMRGMAVLDSRRAIWAGWGGPPAATLRILRHGVRSEVILVLRRPVSMWSRSRFSHQRSLVPGVRWMSSAAALSPAGRGLTWGASKSPRRGAQSPSMVLTVTAIREGPEKQQRRQTLRDQYKDSDKVFQGLR